MENVNGIQWFCTGVNDLAKKSNYIGAMIADSITTTVNLYSDNVPAITGYFDSNSQYPTQNWIYVAPQDTTITEASAFKTWLASHPITVLYELAKPTTEEADPYQQLQLVSPDGTEEFVDALVEAGTRDIGIPVGHNTRYPVDLKSKLEEAPDSPSADGDYIMRRVNGENTYTQLVIPDELPTSPSTDGTYTLQVVVADGTPTLSWVSNA
jgi:hypothetical protein